MVKWTTGNINLNGMSTMTFSFDNSKLEDKAIIENFIHDINYILQKTCYNCSNYYVTPCLGAYNGSACKIYNNLEAYNNPHKDLDGSKCPDYIRKEI